MRKCCEEAKHYYTIELRGPKVVQVRGMGNCDMTPKVEAFINHWKQQVLCKQDIAV